MNTIHAVYFSPTGNTKTVTERAADKLAAILGLSVQNLDLTLPEARGRIYEFGEEDLVVVGTPTYAGRVPNKFLPDLQRVLRGQQTPAVGIVTFGNRSYDNSLAELLEVLETDGFRLVAGAAMVCSHVFSDLIAPDRPDGDDLCKLDIWAEQAARKLSGGAGEAPALSGGFLRGLPEARHPVGPYYTPLGVDGQPAKFLKAKPVTDLTRCDRCGICANVCPMGSIPAEDPAETAGICIKCQACVRLCPQKARHIEDPAFLSHVKMLEQNYTRPAEAEFFL